MIALIDKNTNKVLNYFDRLEAVQNFIVSNGLNEENLIKAEVMDMKYVSRITSVDGICVYNNKPFWLNNAMNILENYDKHTVLDILGQPIDKARFTLEWQSNSNRLYVIDGRPGQIEYNMEVGNEFISLFREECILTNFTKDSDTSPMIIFQKLDTVINMLQIGGFREARQYLQAYRAQIRDDFLTNERIDKYIDMLNAADAIEYATDEDYFYTAPEDAEEE